MANTIIHGPLPVRQDHLILAKPQPKVLHCPALQTLRNGINCPKNRRLINYYFPSNRLINVSILFF